MSDTVCLIQGNGNFSYGYAPCTLWGNFPAPAGFFRYNSEIFACENFEKAVYLFQLLK